MTVTNFRTEKLVKELESIFQKRLDNFENLKDFIREQKTTEHDHVRFLFGRSVGIKRTIRDLLISFKLTETELYTKNSEHFEVHYLKKMEEKLNPEFERYSFDD